MMILNRFCRLTSLFSRLKMFVTFVFTLIGFVAHIWLISKAYMLLRIVSATTIRYQEILHQLRTFTAYRGLSNSIQERILTFYDFSFNGNYFRKREINELLGSELRQFVTLETSKELLKGNFIFSPLNEELIGSIANCLTESIYLSNDVIAKVESARAQVKFL